jgi:hypothetical protein
MTVLPVRWRKALLLYAWRLLERWRLRLVRAQAWLERRFGDWGEEFGFASAMERGDEEDTAAVPAHWAALVRRGAPWLLRQPAPPGGPGPDRQPVLHAASPQRGVASVSSAVEGAVTFDGIAAVAPVDDAAAPPREGRETFRVFRAESGRMEPGRRFHVPPRVTAAVPAQADLTPCAVDSIAGTAGPASAIPVREAGAKPGGSRISAPDTLRTFDAAMAAFEQENRPTEAHEARHESVTTSPAGAVKPAAHRAVADLGSSAAWPGSPDAPAEFARQRSGSVLVSPASCTVEPSWPALPGEEEGGGGAVWPDLPGSAGASIADDELDARDELQERRWSA